MKPEEYALVRSQAEEIVAQGPWRVPAVASIPQGVANSLEGWVNGEYLPGSFVEAVLENDLTMAVMQADSDSLVALKAIVSTLVLRAPSACWGSPAKARAWWRAVRAARARKGAGRGAG